METQPSSKIVDLTIFVSVYGSIRLHPWVDLALLDEDAYSVFTARAVSMGWSSTGRNALAAHVLWHMNDAGQDWPQQGSNRVAWFQVATANDSPDREHSLPTQPILACVRDSLNRLGDLTLTGVQMLLPVHLAGDAIGHLSSGLSWFKVGRPDTRVPIRVTIDAGQDDVTHQKADDLFALLSKLAMGLFTFETSSGSDSHAVRLDPTVVGDMWLGSGRHPATFTGTAPEWSFDALGWLAELCATACHMAGITTTVLFSVCHDKAPD